MASKVNEVLKLTESSSSSSTRRNPDDHDALLLTCLNRILFTLPDCISEYPMGNGVLGFPLLKDKESRIPLLGDMLRGSLLFKKCKFSTSILLVNLIILAQRNSENLTSYSQWVRGLFNISKEEHDRTVVELKQFTANKRTAYAELKCFIDDIYGNSVPLSRIHDFQTSEAFEAWSEKEKGFLQTVLADFLARF